MKAQLREWVDSVEGSRLGKDYESRRSIDNTAPVIGRLSDARLGTVNWDTIRQIQVDVAEKHPRAAWIDTDDLNGPNNEVHCPPDGYKQMGIRFAEAAVELITRGDEAKQ